MECALRITYPMITMLYIAVCVWGGGLVCLGVCVLGVFGCVCIQTLVCAFFINLPQLMVSRATSWRRMKQLGVSPTEYSDISEAELDSVIATLVRDFSNSGIVMMWGLLRSMIIHVPQRRVTESLHRVSLVAVSTRQRSTVCCRAYSVPAPNSLWHIDGLHYWCME